MTTTIEDDQKNEGKEKRKSIMNAMIQNTDGHTSNP